MLHKTNKTGATMQQNYLTYLLKKKIEILKILHILENVTITIISIMKILT